ncbi:MAG TPA: SPOR domain-containing protein [Marinilabiliaceae bacterium]|nr:SPOR domain-containing protein [Marinilabiliaceae bacterium]
MEKYLQELIQSQNRIIIPDFGAFIISRDNGHHILFNNFLTFNDGLLVRYICEEEGLNSDQALERVGQFIEKVKSTLIKDGQFRIDKIGTLFRTEGGVISFESEEVEKEIKESEQDSSVKEEKKEHILIDDNELLDLDLPKTADREDVKPEAKKPTPPSKEEQSAATLSSPRSSAKPPSTLIMKDQRKNKFPSWIWLVLILLLLLIGFALIFTFSNIPEKVKEWYHSRGEQTEVVKENLLQPELKPLPIDSSAFKKEVKKEEVKVISPTVTRQHHVIVGAFKKKSDALSLKNKLIAQGLKSATVLEHEGRYLVSSNWYSSVSPALRRQEELLKTHKLENWVLSIDVQ